MQSKYILGLAEKPATNEVNIALVKDGAEVIARMSLPSADLNIKVKEFIEEYLPSSEQLTAIAYTDEFNQGTGFIKTKSVLVDGEDALFQSITTFASDAEEERLEINYPQLVMLDQAEKTEIFIAESDQERKSIKQLQPHSISQLIETFEELLETKKLPENMQFGDEAAYVFSKDDAEYKPEFKLEHLYQELEYHLQQYQSQLPDNLKKDVKAQMDQYFKFDAAASVMDALMDNIIAHLFATAAEVGIKNISVIGEIEKLTRFRAKFTNQAQALNFELRFPTHDTTADPAIGVAAAGFLQV